jgi:serine protein kinase
MSLSGFANQQRGRTRMSKLFADFKTNFEKTKKTEFTLEEYLDMCKTDRMAYAWAVERMLAAIGEPKLVDTSEDSRLSRIFLNRTIKVYDAFKDFYGMEATIERIVSFFMKAAQGLEEKKQVLYLMGPVGSAKSSLAERLKSLMEKMPIYVLKAGDQISPVFESPLGLFDPNVWADRLQEDYGIPRRYLTGLMSPWAVKRLNEEFDGDISKFTVVKLYPSKLKQIAISKVEPGDENNQDISSLVGKVDIRKLAEFSARDTDAYSYAGGLCLANQGVLEFVEMFKAPIKMLHPMLTATQEGNYNGTEAISGIPFQGIILAHSNESEWESFKGNKNNEAFLDRISIVKVPYCLRVTDETKIYQKLLRDSSLDKAPCTPKTLELLSQMSVLSRLIYPENSSLHSKMKVYDGENIKETDPYAKSVQEYRELAGVNEGMTGLSTRWAFKVLSSVFNYDPMEIGANPVHLFRILEDKIVEEQFPKEIEEELREHLQWIKTKYIDFIGNEIQVAYLESYSEYGQNMFDRYIIYADHWIEDKDYRDQESGEMYNRDTLNRELEKIEKPSGIANPKEFRNEVVKYALRYKANHGKYPKWNSYEKLKEVIEKKMFSNISDLLPVISFEKKSSEEHEKKHKDFVQRMKEKGYSERQTRIIVDWFMKVQKSN